MSDDRFVRGGFQRPWAVRKANPRAADWFYGYAWWVLDLNAEWGVHPLDEAGMRNYFGPKPYVFRTHAEAIRYAQQQASAATGPGSD